MATDEGCVTLTGRAEIYANVAASFCSAYSTEGRGGEILGILTACLRGMPLYVAKHIMKNCADCYTIQGQFLEVQSSEFAIC